MRKGEEDQGAKVVKLISAVLLGGVLALLVSLLFLFLCSIAISRGILKEGLMLQLTVASCVIGTFVGGMAAVGKCRTRTLLTGLGVGLVLFLLLLTIGVLFFDSMGKPAGGLPLLCACICGGGLAGLLGSKPKKKRRK